MSALAVLGGGSWGTALALALAPRFAEVRLWVHDPAKAAEMAATRENTAYLPGFPLPDGVCVTPDLASALNRVEAVLGVVPSPHVRQVYGQVAPLLDEGVVFVSATKGIENGTLLRMSEVVGELLGAARPMAVLSGPTFAKEVAGGEPAVLVIASHDAEVARRVQAAFSGPAFRLYTNGDPVGVELGAALKNVIAIGAGVCQGLGLGNNTTAALVTRGLAEITRLAVAMGGQARTLAGLAGLGDLMLTCTGDLSRNRHVGLELARGRRLPEIVASMRMVAEGVHTTKAARELAQRHGVEMPILEQVHAILEHGRAPREAVRELMERGLKDE